MRFFEKISYEQFKKDVKDDVNLYNSYHIPARFQQEKQNLQQVMILKR